MKLFLIFLFTLFELLHGRLQRFSEPPTCRWDDPNLTSCIVGVLETLRPLIKTGIPGVVPRLDPFAIPVLPFDISLMVLKIKGDLTDVLISGGSEAKIINFILDIDNKVADLMVVIPELDISGYFYAELRKLHVIDESMKGKFTSQLFNVTVRVRAEGAIEYYGEYDQKHLIITDVSADVNIGKKSWYHLDLIEGSWAAKLDIKLANLAPNRLVFSMVRSIINRKVEEIIKEHFGVIINKLILHTFVD